jgi:prolyl-tRNA editing enzyme YbaK/EbsC (Cys-tRNA(Pro) deacylase)
MRKDRRSTVAAPDKKEIGPGPLYCDVSIRTFDEAAPTAGSTQSAIHINPLRMAEVVEAE